MIGFASNIGYFASTENGRHQLPLFGHFCCRLAAQPSCMVQEVCSSFVHVPESCIQKGASKDKRSWVKCWAQLLAFKLRLWTNYERYLEDKEPDACISVNRVSKLLECKCFEMSSIRWFVVFCAEYGYQFEERIISGFGDLRRIQYV